MGVAVLLTLMYLQYKGGKLFRGNSKKVIASSSVLNGLYSLIFMCTEVHYLNNNLQGSC